ncbi:hypothetical protein [Haloactinomyces albus]|uniref:YggT family protein n=1 Tax=Haloactinomyces albus TaxID=1352928 RepID=A0AAE3ZBC3_9ACTN|nr:hypothetical protein [Haloactinomyces albus]MDR7301776.1 hypothetical protein [Haloactinomyces albus]
MSEGSGNPARAGETGEQQKIDTHRGEQAFVAGRRRRRTSDSFDFAKARARVVTVIAALVRWAGNLAAVILAAHVVLTVGGANPDNSITRFVADWAKPLALGFRNLFPQPGDPELDVLVNYGLAALFWLIVTSLAVKIVRALG